MLHVITYVIIYLRGFLSMKFSELVKYVRQELNISQEDLARAINVSFATVNRWENNKSNPNRLTKKVFLEFCKQNNINNDMLIETLLVNYKSI